MTAWRMYVRIAFLSVICAPSCSTPTAYQKINIDLSAYLQEATALGPGDIFEVRVYGENDLTGTYQVSPAGKILFPFLGEVSVENLSPNGVATQIAAQLRQGYLREPQVTVFVKEYRSKKVYVLGEVNKPGTFPYQEQMSIVQAITLAGGFRPLASKNFTIVTRVESGAEQRIPVPVEKISEGLAPNFALKPGDIVFVPETIL